MKPHCTMAFLAPLGSVTRTSTTLTGGRGPGHYHVTYAIVQLQVVALRNNVVGARSAVPAHASQ